MLVLTWDFSLSRPPTPTPHLLRMSFLFVVLFKYIILFSGSLSLVKNLIADQIDREIVFMSYIEMFIDS